LWQELGKPSQSLGQPSNRNMGPLGSAPSACIDFAGATCVYWKGNGSNLGEGYWGGAKWVGPFNRGMGPLGSAPFAVINPNNGTVYVFWTGTDGNLWLPTSAKLRLQPFPPTHRQSNM